MGHGDQTLASVIRIQNGVVLSIQLEVEDLEVLLDALGIGGLWQRDGSNLNLFSQILSLMNMYLYKKFNFESLPDIGAPLGRWTSCIYLQWPAPWHHRYSLASFQPDWVVPEDNRRSPQYHSFCTGQSVFFGSTRDDTRSGK